MKIQRLMEIIVIGTFAVSAYGDNQKEGDGNKVAFLTHDVSGIAFKTVGLQSGSKPCGSGEQIKSRLDQEGRYFSYCQYKGKENSVIQITPPGVEQIPLENIEDHLMIYGVSKKTRSSNGSDNVKSSARRNLASGNGFGIATACQNPSFLSHQCSGMSSWIVAPSANNKTWCRKGRHTWAQRTQSSQTSGFSNSGRSYVIACGTASTRVRSYGKNSKNAWVIKEDVVLKPNYSHTSNLIDFRDMRFRVDSHQGGFFRYTGAFKYRNIAK